MSARWYVNSKDALGMDDAAGPPDDALASRVGQGNTATSAHCKRCARKAMLDPNASHVPVTCIQVSALRYVDSKDALGMDDAAGPPDDALASRVGQGNTATQVRLDGPGRQQLPRPRQLLLL